jgi:hypothetical protein
MEKFVNHNLEVKLNDEFDTMSYDATEGMPSEAFADFGAEQQDESQEYTPEDVDMPDFDGYDPTDTELV